MKTTQTATHTPGPWKVYRPDSVRDSLGIDAKDETVVLFDDRAGIIGENREANARLISSAPELLEALSASVIEMDDTLDHLSRLNPAENSAYVRDLRNAISFARAAIAKAIGETK